jgi:rare lipoprotein A
MYHASIFLHLAACLCFTISLNAQQYYYKGNGANAAKVEVGDAVYYADYLEGRTTALGEVYRKNAYTAAHRTYAKGTLIEVTRLDNGKSVVVRVNDRGPYSQGVVVDVSKAAAMALGLLRDGRARVKVEAVGFSETNPGQEVATANTQARQSAPQQRNSVYYPTPQQYNTTQERLTAKGGSSYNTNTPQSYSNTPQSSSTYNALASRSVPQSYQSSSPASSSAGIRLLPEGTQGYAIQVASFQNIDNANRQVRALNQQGLKDVYIMRKGALNKIVIAAFPNKLAAQQYLEGLRQQYLVDGIVIMLR